MRHHSFTAESRMKPCYTYEPTPIFQERRQGGGIQTQLGDLDGRVVDNYTKMPIGAVIYVVCEKKAKFQARPFFPDSRAGEIEVREIQRDWGPRADLAAKAIWRQWHKGLPLKERAKRLLWRWERIGWLMLGTIVGATTQLVLRNL